MKEQNKIQVDESDKKDESNPKTTLKDFIDENGKLISILGVFSALSVFIQEVTKGPIGQLFGYILSFLFLFLSIIILFELLFRTDVDCPSVRFRLFKYMLEITIFGIILYWLLSYRSIWRVVMPFFVWISLTLILSYFATKSNIIEKLTSTKSTTQKILRIGGILFFLGLVFYLFPNIAEPISEVINNGLDDMRNGLERFYESIEALHPITG